MKPTKIFLGFIITLYLCLSIFLIFPAFLLHIIGFRTLFNYWESALDYLLENYIYE